MFIFFTKGPTFHVTANFYIIGFLTGWSYFSMSFDWLAAKIDCDWLSFGMWLVQKETMSQGVKSPFIRFWMDMLKNQLQEIEIPIKYMYFDIFRFKWSSMVY